jgi:hypothetical protein
LFGNQAEEWKKCEWTYFGRKINMLIKDLQAYAEAQKAFEFLERNFSHKVRRLAELKSELHKVMESNRLSFGFFKRVSKESRLKDLRLKITRLDHDITVEEKLIALAAAVIVQHEIPAIKLRKKERIDETILEFAHARMKKIQEERSLWQIVIDIRGGPDDTHNAAEQNWDEQQYQAYRITE